MNKLFFKVLPIAIFCFIILSTGTVLFAEEMKAKDDDGILVLETEDGAFRYQLDSRIYIDWAVMDEDEDVVDLQSGSEIRRMRIAFKTVLWTDWIAEFDVDFAENEVGIKDAYVGYKGIDGFLIKAGNFRSPFSLEELTSSRYVSFIERALPNAFAPGRLVGVGINKWGSFWQIGAGVFGQEAGDYDEAEGEESDESISYIGRVTVAPLNNGSNVIHLGAAYAYRTPDAFGDSIRYRGYDETKLSKIRFLNTGKEKEVDHAGLLGLEGVIQLGPLHIQGEYMQSDVTRLDDSDKPDYSVSGGYVFGSFFITGDCLPYDNESGEFTRLVPKKEMGAIELLFRYSWLDLNDLDNGIEGGYGENLTFGITWYFNPNIKFLVNYTIVDHDKYADADGDWDVPEDGFDYNILAARFLITL